MASKDITITATGEEILKAVRVVAGEFLVVIKQTSVFILGQKRGIDLYSHLVVLADQKLGIDPNETYQQITVREWNWGGLVWEIKENPLKTKMELCNFAKKLQEELANQQKQEKKA